MPRARVRCTTASTPLLWSVMSSTRAACGLTRKTWPTMPAGREHRRALRDARRARPVDGERAREPGRVAADDARREQLAVQRLAEVEQLAQPRVLELDLGEPRRARARGRARASRSAVGLVARAPQADDAVARRPPTAAARRRAGALERRHQLEEEPPEAVVARAARRRYARPAPRPPPGTAPPSPAAGCAAGTRASRPAGATAGH